MGNHLSLPGFSRLTLLHQGRKSVVYRATRDSDEQSFILKTCIERSRSSVSTRTMEREYRMYRSVDSRYVARAHDIVSSEHRHLLLMEDIRGTSVDKLFDGKRLAVHEALRLSLGVLEGIDALHQSGMIHKDVNPSNIVLNSNTGQVHLIDLSLATRLTEEVTEIGTIGNLEGNLAYVSPEQTGRMNRPIDFRSDYYSLGITLYEWLTGSLPFDAGDAMAQVHHHIAQIPIAPHHRCEEIPPALSAIVLKLLSKSADDRYQSASGIASDLAACLRGEDLTSFQPGSADRGERFRLPQCFYGRTHELQQLHEAFEAVCEGRQTAALVSGPGGIGKTAFIQELIRPITQHRGFFLRGKFDQFNRDELYHGIVQALRRWLADLLSQEEAEIARWREQIAFALHDKAALLMDLLPELQELMGPVPAVNTATGDGPLGLQLCFDALLRVLSCPSHPLVLVLDDVQWADPASIELLKLVLRSTEPRAMLVVLALRDTGADKVIGSFAALQMVDIRLGPLSRRNMQQWLTDTFPDALQPYETLAHWVHTKTEGNPFFVREFLRSLHAAGQVSFDRARRGWVWDLPAIEQASITNNVVEFLLAKLLLLPEDTQTLLRYASCLGNRFDLQTVALLCDSDITSMVRSLWPAVVGGMLQPLGDAWLWWERSADDPGLEEVEDDDARQRRRAPVPMQFVHDRIHQAAYTLIPEEQRPELHFHVATRLMATLSEAQRRQHLFQICRHLKLGSALLTDEALRAEAATLHLAAGKRARASAAFAAAYANFRSGLALLSEGCWEEDRALAAALHLGAIDAGYACGEEQPLLALVEETLRHIPPGPERSTIHRIQVLALSASQRYPEAIEVALRGLKELGLRLPHPVTRARVAWEFLRARLAFARLESLDCLPDMTDELALAQHRLLAAMSSACYMSDAPLATVVICRQMRLLSTSGVGPYRDVYVAFAAGIVKLQGQVDLAHAFADPLVHRPGGLLPHRTAFHVNYFLDYWRKPANELYARCNALVSDATESGDTISASFAIASLAVFTMFWADDLRVHRDVIKRFERFNQQFEGPLVERYNGYYLTELKERATILLQPPGDERELLHPDWIDRPYGAISVHASDRTAQANHQIMVATLHALFGHSSRALALTDALADAPDGGNGFFCTYYALHYVRPLAALDEWPHLSRSHRRRRMRIVRQALRALDTAANRLPETFRPMWHAVEAERRRVLGQTSEALHHFLQAIEWTTKSQRIGEHAMVCERAARFCASHGQPRLAGQLFREAVTSYERWGAPNKASQLRQILPSEHVPDRAAEGGRLAVDPLDLITAIKTSQALSREIELGPLLDKLIRAVSENVGAQRGVLFLSGADPSSPDALHVAATYAPDSVGPKSGAPFAVARYVGRTGQPLLIDDMRAADAAPVFDAYLAQERPRCVLAVPIAQKEERLGVLYFEHGESPGVFTAHHLEFLHLLIGQIAVSLTNARLYDKLQAERRSADEARRIAEAASQAKSFFLAKMSHELRTPLTAILGYTDLIREELEEQGEREFDHDLDRIQLAGRGLLQFVGNILDLTKIESGRIDVLKEELSTAVLLAETLEEVQLAFQLTGNALVLETGALLPQLITDKQKLRQILLTLLDNANKYTRRGTVTLRGTSEQEAERAWVRFEVVDTGIGIEAEFLQAIFAAFTQVDNTYTRRSDGAGLGLSIAHGLCRALGGSLEVQSEFGRGSCFTVRLPAGQTEGRPMPWMAERHARS